jgi:hypothetical protein
VREICDVEKDEIRTEALQFGWLSPLCPMWLVTCITRQIFDTLTSQNISSQRTVRLGRFVLHSRNGRDFGQSLYVFCYCVGKEKHVHIHIQWHLMINKTLQLGW